MKGLIITILVLIGIGAAVYFWRSGDNGLTLPDDRNGVACTMDAMLCPDGSYVGRVPPTCEFAECPAGTTTIPTSTPTSTNEIRGS